MVAIILRLSARSPSRCSPSDHLENATCGCNMQVSHHGCSASSPFKMSVVGRACLPLRFLWAVDDGVSRTHAKVEYRAGRLWVTDLKSSNGTILDGKVSTIRRQVAVHPRALGFVSLGLCCRARSRAHEHRPTPARPTGIMGARGRRLIPSPPVRLQPVARWWTGHLQHSRLAAWSAVWLLGLKVISTVRWLLTHARTHSHRKVYQGVCPNGCRDGDVLSARRMWSNSTVRPMASSLNWLLFDPR